MRPDAIYPGHPMPFPNEVITIVMLASVVCGVSYLVWRVQRDGMIAFRRSALFLVVLETAMAAYVAWGASR